MARNIPNDLIPKNLYYNNVIIDENVQANVFANFFLEKVKSIKNSLTISNEVYNGKNKLIVYDRFFINQENVKECILSLKPKNVRDSIESQYVYLLMLKNYYYLP